MNLEKLPDKENQNHGEDILQFKKTKEKLVKFDIFDKEFIENLNIYIGDPYRKYLDKEPFVNIPCVTLDNEPIVVEGAKINRGTDVVICPRSALSLDRFNDAEHLQIKKWFEGIDFESLYSFEAVAVHEMAHAKSLQLIPPGKDYEYLSGKMESIHFNKEEFLKQTNELIKNDFNLQRLKSVDFSKFSFSLRSWTEIYALLYQREFLRRDNLDNENKIKEWDAHTIETAVQLAKRVEEGELKPNYFYGSYSLSYLLARPLENEFPNFEARIKFLEQFKK